MAIRFLDDIAVYRSTISSVTATSGLSPEEWSFSPEWEDAYTTISILSAQEEGQDQATSLVQLKSALWEQAFAHANQTSAQEIQQNLLITLIQAHSALWERTFTFLSQTSAQDALNEEEQDRVVTIVQNNSAIWDVPGGTDGGFF
jgi:hypothetical protein